MFAALVVSLLIATVVWALDGAEQPRARRGHNATEVYNDHHSKNHEGNPWWSDGRKHLLLCM
jgi:hypothetical protein